MGGMLASIWNTKYIGEWWLRWEGGERDLFCIPYTCEYYLNTLYLEQIISNFDPYISRYMYLVILQTIMYLSK